MLVAGPVVSQQITLTETNHAPAVNETYEMFTGTVGVPGPAGTGVVWDFQNIVTSNTAVTYTAVAATNANYPNAEVTINNSLSESAHFSSSPSSLLYYGGNIKAGTVAGNMTYTNPAIEASYPMSLNTTSGAATSGSIQITAPFPVSANFTGTSSVKSDGTGTIVLPGGGTYTNALRVVATQSFEATAMGQTATVVRDVYSYYTPNIKSPVVVVAIMSATALGSPSTSTLVLRNKNAPGVIPTTTNSIQENAIGKTTVFPNPAVSKVEFRNSHIQSGTISLYDLTGKFTRAAVLKEGAAIMDLSDLERGLYLYTVSGADGKTAGSGKLAVSR
jgi:hypothetical protein